MKSIFKQIGNGIGTVFSGISFIIAIAGLSVTTACCFPFLLLAYLFNGGNIKTNMKK